MRKRFISLMLLSIVLSILAVEAEAGSIWAKRQSSAKNLYADDKANQVGDVLTIIINEDHKVDNKVNRKLEKTTSSSVDFNGDNFTVEHLIPSLPSIRIGASSSKSLDGKADYKDERTIEDRITVIVEDVHPNGNLVVIGTRTREVSGDKQIIQVSGIVRPSDILYGNTVRSDQVGNFQMIAISDGVTGDYNEPGWLGKIFDIIWPF